MGRPEITATRSKRAASSASSAGTPGSGRAPTGSSTMADRVPSKSRNSAPWAGSAASGLQWRRQRGRGGVQRQVTRCSGAGVAARSCADDHDHVGAGRVGDRRGAW